MARKSKKQISAEAALANLECIAALAKEAGDLAADSRETNKCYIYHAHDIRRWERALQEMAWQVPVEVERHRVFWR